jgi:hypothetical protein
VPRWVLEQHRGVHALDASDKFVEISEMLVLHDAQNTRLSALKHPAAGPVFDQLNRLGPCSTSTGLTAPILAGCAEPLSQGSNFLDVLPAWMLIHP